MTRAAFIFIAALLLTDCGATPRPALTPAGLPAPGSPVSSLQHDLTAIFQASQFDRAYWSVLVRPAGSDEELFGLHAGKLMMPGSTLKIVTAAAAAERLGWNHRFETRVVATAPIESGVLKGDLAIVGGGDPGISERSDPPGALRSIARQVRDAGVERIEGGIIGHDDLFDEGFGDGWTLDNLPYGYSAPVSALTYNEGSVDLVIRAGTAAGEAVAIQVRPDGSGLSIENRLVTVGETGTGRLTLRRVPGSSRVIVEGQIPAKAAPFARTASVDNPTAFFAEAFRLALIAEGVQVTGEAIDIDDVPSKLDLSGGRTLVTHQSPPLSELALAMMRVSQNQYAELLLRSIGGRRSVQEILTSWDIAQDGYVVADGSGLSRYNYITSDALVRILQRMHRDTKHASPFLLSLPVSVGDGPLARRFAGTAADGKVIAKTGTVDNVRAIAGYVQTAGGETLAFSIIANNFNVPISAVDAAADNALIRLAGFSRR